MPTTLNVIQGTTFSGRVTVTNSDGSYVNLAGLTSSGYVRNRYSQSGYLFSLSPTVHSSYVSGIIDFLVPASTTLTSPIGKFPYDINVYGANGYVERVSYGTCEVEPIATY